MLWEKKFYTIGSYTVNDLFNRLTWLDKIYSETSLHMLVDNVGKIGKQLQFRQKPPCNQRVSQLEVSEVFKQFRRIYMIYSLYKTRWVEDFWFFGYSTYYHVILQELQCNDLNEKLQVCWLFIKTNICKFCQDD